MPTQTTTPYPTPRPSWAVVELLVAGTLIVAGLKLEIVLLRYGSIPWLVAFAALFLWWRRVDVLGFGLGRPASWRRTILVGVLVGVGYQFLGTFVVEPAITRWTTGQLPDVSGFRSLVGDKAGLAFWIGYAWVMAALLEEIAFRGWILTRFAELGRFSTSAWVAGMLASSVLFGGVHVYQGVSGMIATGLSGFVFAVVYLATGRNLWAAIVAHGAMDTAGFVMIYFGVYPGL